MAENEGGDSKFLTGFLVGFFVGVLVALGVGSSFVLVRTQQHRELAMRAEADADMARAMAREAEARAMVEKAKADAEKANADAKKPEAAEDRLPEPDVEEDR
jgi:hypothetical protein